MWYSQHTMGVRTNVPLAPFTTLQLGGPAARMVEASTEIELIDALKEAEQRNEVVFVLGRLVGDS